MFIIGALRQIMLNPAVALHPDGNGAVSVKVASETDKRRKGNPGLDFAMRQSILLTAAQKTLLAALSVRASPAAGMIVGEFAIAADVTNNRLSEAVATAVENHRLLRSRLISTDCGHALSDVADLVPGMQIARMESGTEAEIDALVAMELQRPFDLFAGPLVRFLLLDRDGPEPGSDSRVLLIIVHHIIADFPAMDLLAHELNGLCDEAVRPAILRDATTSDDYALNRAFQIAAQRAAGEDRHAEMVEFWRDLLAAPYSPARLDGRSGPPFAGAGEGVQLRCGMNPVRSHLFRGFAKALKATPFETSFALFILFLFHRTEGNRISVGVTIDRRRRREFRSAFGYLVEALPIIVDRVDSGLPLVKCLETVILHLRRSLRHGGVGFGRLQEIGFPVAPGEPPFRILFNYLRFDRRFGNADENQWRALTGLRRTAAPASRGSIHDVVLTVEEWGNGLEFVWTFDSEFFSAHTAANLVGDFSTFLGHAIASRSGAGEPPAEGEIETFEI